MVKIVEYKKCRICRLKKPIDNFRKFYVKCVDKYYYRSDCIKCELKQGREYYANHKEKKSMYRKKYYKENREVLLKKRKEKYHNNRLSQLMLGRLYYIRGRSKVFMNEKKLIKPFIPSKNFKHIHDILDDLKINGCAICGYDKCNDYLKFYHMGENKKKFTINVFGITKNNNKSIARELNKCVLLCDSCGEYIKNSID